MITGRGRDECLKDLFIGEDWVSVPMEDGRRRFTRFEPVFAEKKCKAYVPQAHRK